MICVRCIAKSFLISLMLMIVWLYKHYKNNCNSSKAQTSFSKSNHPSCPFE